MGAAGRPAGASQVRGLCAGTDIGADIGTNIGTNIGTTEGSPDVITTATVINTSGRTPESMAWINASRGEQSA